MKQVKTQINEISIKFKNKAKIFMLVAIAIIQIIKLEKVIYL